MHGIVAAVIVLVALGSCGNQPYESSQGAQVASTDSTVQQAEPFAVVELFTSEGCLDCPPAEELLNKITKKALADKSYIYPLAFHVDYWNKLGWRDVFSDSSFSNRQRRYREVFGHEVVYTPQMVVNGQVEFVGSDENKADSAINAMLKRTPEAYFTIHPRPEMTGHGSFPVEYEVISMPPAEEPVAYDLCFAMVERGLVTQVKRGENKDKTLLHDNVVHTFISVELKEMKGKVMMPPLYKQPSKNHSLIAFIQDRQRMRIIGANVWNF